MGATTRTRSTRTCVGMLAPALQGLWAAAMVVALSIVLALLLLLLLLPVLLLLLGTAAAVEQEAPPSSLAVKSQRMASRASVAARCAIRATSTALCSLVVPRRRRKRQGFPTPNAAKVQLPFRSRGTRFFVHSLLFSQVRSDGVRREGGKEDVTNSGCEVLEVVCNVSSGRIKNALFLKTTKRDRIP